jgi:two-component system, NarL family, nitrate/nitrite response regulator NarL
VVIVADSSLLRAGLVALASALPGVLVVAQHEYLDALDLPAVGGVDLVLWGLGEQAEGGPGAELLATTPTVLVVESAARVPELLAAGARGVLWRDLDGERLGAAIQAVLAGATVLDEGMVPVLLERKAAQAPGVELTPRETEVLGLMAEGLSNKLIAARLGISEHTAKFHVNAVLDKLGAETRTEAVVRAARQGLLML